MKTPKKRGRPKGSKKRPKVAAGGERNSSKPTSQPSTRRDHQSPKVSGDDERPITRQTTFLYRGPPEYLLDPNRKDPYADVNNVIQDPDGTNRPKDWGGYQQDSRVHWVVKKDEEALETAQTLDMIAKVSPL